MGGGTFVKDETSSLPSPGSWVHEIGHPSINGTVVAVIWDAQNRRGAPVIVARFWWKYRRRWEWKCFRFSEWAIGLLRPGRAPKEKRRR